MRQTYQRLHRAVTLMPPGLRGLLLLTIAVGVATVNHAIIRHLGADLPPEEVVVVRHVFGLIVLSPFIWRFGVRRTFRTNRFALHMTRGVIGGFGSLAWYTGLTLIPFVEATALSFLSVMFVTVGAVLFLGEKAGPRRWGAVVAGFVGALIILRPGFEAVSTGSLIVLVSAVTMGATMLLLKVLTRTEAALTIVVYMYLYRIGVSVVPATINWVWPTPEQWAWFMLMGVLSSVTNMAQAQAFKDADATLLAPVRFTRLIWAALIGFFVFSEIPDGWTMLGGAVIAGSISYIAYREAQIRRQKAAADADD